MSRTAGSLNSHALHRHAHSPHRTSLGSIFGSLSQSHSQAADYARSIQNATTTIARSSIIAANFTSGSSVVQALQAIESRLFVLVNSSDADTTEVINQLQSLYRQLFKIKDTNSALSMQQKFPDLDLTVVKVLSQCDSGEQRAMVMKCCALLAQLSAQSTTGVRVTAPSPVWPRWFDRATPSSLSPTDALLVNALTEGLQSIDDTQECLSLYLIFTIIQSPQKSSMIGLLQSMRVLPMIAVLLVKHSERLSERLQSFINESRIRTLNEILVSTDSNAILTHAGSDDSEALLRSEPLVLSDSQSLHCIKYSSLVLTEALKIYSHDSNNKSVLCRLCDDQSLGSSLLQSSVLVFPALVSVHTLLLQQAVTATTDYSAAVRAIGQMTALELHCFTVLLEHSHAASTLLTTSCSTSNCTIPRPTFLHHLSSIIEWVCSESKLGESKPSALRAVKVSTEILKMILKQRASNATDTDSEVITELLMMLHSVSDTLIVLMPQLNRSSNHSDELTDLEDSVTATFACFLLLYHQNGVSQPSSQLMQSLVVSRMIPLGLSLLRLQSSPLSTLHAFFAAMTQAIKASDSDTDAITIIQHSIQIRVFEKCLLLFQRLTDESVTETNSETKKRIEMAASAAKKLFAIVLSRLRWTGSSNLSSESSADHWLARLAAVYSWQSMASSLDQNEQWQFTAALNAAQLAERFDTVIALTLLIAVNQTVNEDAGSDDGSASANGSSLDLSPIAASLQGWLNAGRAYHGAANTHTSSSPVTLVSLRNAALIRLAILTVLLYNNTQLLSLSSTAKELIVHQLRSREIGIDPLIVTVALDWVPSHLLLVWIWQQRPTLTAVSRYQTFLIEDLIDLTNIDIDRRNDSECGDRLLELTAVIISSANAIKAFGRRCQQSFSQWSSNASMLIVSLEHDSPTAVSASDIAALLIVAHSLCRQSSEAAMKLLAVGVHHAVFQLIELGYRGTSMRSQSSLSSMHIIGNGYHDSSPTTTDVSFELLELICALLTACQTSTFTVTVAACQAVSEFALAFLTGSAPATAAISRESFCLDCQPLAAKILTLLLSPDSDDDCIVAVMESIDRDKEFKASILSLVHQGFAAPVSSYTARVQNRRISYSSANVSTSDMSVTSDATRARIHVQLSAVTLITAYLRAQTRVTHSLHMSFQSLPITPPIDDLFELLYHDCCEIRIGIMNYLTAAIETDTVTFVSGSDSETINGNHTADDHITALRLNPNHLAALLLIITNDLLPETPFHQSLAALELLAGLICSHRLSGSSVVSYSWLEFVTETRMLDFARYVNSGGGESQQRFALLARLLSLLAPTDCDEAQLALKIISPTLVKAFADYGLQAGINTFSDEAQSRCISTTYDFLSIAELLVLIDDSIREPLKVQLPSIWRAMKKLNSEALERQPARLMCPANLPGENGHDSASAQLVTDTHSPALLSMSQSASASAVPRPPCVCEWRLRAGGTLVSESIDSIVALIHQLQRSLPF